MEPIEGKLLGKQVSYPQKYAPEILVAVPRSLNREIYNLHNHTLPFIGVDAWHGWELSFLTQKGLPVAGVLKLVYPANSTFLVESKSLKLYLNAFNMERFGCTPKEGIDEILQIIKNDLSQLLNCEVEASLFLHPTEATPFDFEAFTLLENNSLIETIDFTDFTENADILKSPGSRKSGVMNVATHLLRSNCKITHQPDWGSAFIYIKAEQLPEETLLLKYLVSIRNENHFHEEICEMIYKRLFDIFSPDELMVTCIYTRRGGIDICPMRASHQHLIPLNLSNANVLSKKLLQQ